MQDQLNSVTYLYSKETLMRAPLHLEGRDIDGLSMQYA